MNNKLFSYLVGAGIFKQTPRSARCLQRTENRRRERNRGYFVWISKAFRQHPDGTTTVEGKGTFRGSVKQDLA